MTTDVIITILLTINTCMLFTLILRKSECVIQDKPEDDEEFEVVSKVEKKKRPKAKSKDS